MAEQTRDSGEKSALVSASAEGAEKTSGLPTLLKCPNCEGAFEASSGFTAPGGFAYCSVSCYSAFTSD